MAGDGEVADGKRTGGNKNNYIYIYVSFGLYSDMSEL